MPSATHTLEITGPEATLQAHAGELILLNGASGNGKSLWLKRFAGLCPPPTNCSTAIDGHPCSEAAPRLTRMLFDRYPPIWLGQHVSEELSFGLSAQPSMEKMADTLAHWGIPEVSLNEAPEALNRLQGLRLTLATMDLARPALVLLDNPTASLPERDAIAICEGVAAWAKTANLIVVVACNRWHDWRAAATQTWCIQAPDEMPRLGVQT